jgi:hypothetical protein
MTTPIPEDWRAQLMAMIRGLSPLDGALFTGGPGLGPAQQIGVYREQHVLRHRAALRANLPGLTAFWGEAADAQLDAFVREHPSTSWTLEQLGEPMLVWLEAQGAPAEDRALAAVDLAVLKVFHAPAPQPLNPATLAAARLGRSPTAQRLRLSLDAHRWRAQALSGETPSPMTACDARVVVYRHEGRVRHVELPAAADALLAALEPGRAVAEAIDAALQSGADPAALSEAIGPWFRLFVERGLIEAR